MTVAVSKALEDGTRPSSARRRGTRLRRRPPTPRARARRGRAPPAGAVAAGSSPRPGRSARGARGARQLRRGARRRASSPTAAHALVNSLNPNRLEGQKTAAFEIVEELGGPPDVLALPYGGGGNTRAYAKRLRRGGRRLPRFVRRAGAERATTLASAIRIAAPGARRREARVRRRAARSCRSRTTEIVDAWRRLARARGSSASRLRGRRSRPSRGRRAGQRASSCRHRPRPEGHGRVDVLAEPPSSRPRDPRRPWTRRDVSRVRAPATTANLGPGSTAPPRALDLWNELSVDGASARATARSTAEHLGLAGAYARSPRGAAGAFALHGPRSRVSAGRLVRGRDRARARRGGFVERRDGDPEGRSPLGVPLERHADNLAASLAGGVCHLESTGSPASPRRPSARAVSLVAAIDVSTARRRALAARRVSRTPTPRSRRRPALLEAAPRRLVESSPGARRPPARALPASVRARRGSRSTSCGAARGHSPVGAEPDRHARGRGAVPRARPHDTWPLRASRSYSPSSRPLRQPHPL